MENKEIVEKQHPNHFHPLILYEKEDVEGVFCKGCGQPISVPFYACKSCLFFLHKFCAELPQEITHFFHPEHQLQLHFSSLGSLIECDVCGAKVQGFFYWYESTDDDFKVDIKCASMVLKVQQQIKHPNHTHELVPLDQSTMFVCNACNTKHEGNSFLCTKCGFWFNQECVSSPTTVKLKVHDHHLTLLYSVPPNVLNCQICSKEVTKNQWVYSCREPECKYFVHMKCSTSKIKQSREIVEKKHPYHFHPLILYEKEEDVEGVFCKGCGEQVSVPFYACERCLFFLHKFCAELPKEITHFFHPEHPLQLHFSSSGSLVECDVCGAKVRGFFYRYESMDDDFKVDIRCASIVLKGQQLIKHASHTHELVPLDQSTMILCNACNTKHEGNSFLCTECGFWINQECASSPTTIKLGVHDHPLALRYSVPSNVLNCQICLKEVTKNQWVYFCRETKCEYFVHLRCSTLEMEQSSDSKAKSKAKKFARANVMELPWTNASAADDLIARLIKNVISSQAKKSTTTNDDVVKCQTMMISSTTLDHIHKHPLFFHENMQIDPRGESSSSSSSISIASCKQSENKLCNGCGYTISTRVPFYYCADSECNDNFYLHPWCARLPNELEHLCHPKHKLLLITPQSPYFTPRECRCCEIYCDTFLFGCVECEFYVDVKCAVLPAGIRPASHDQHVLTLGQTWGCDSCGSGLGYYTFFCEICDHRVCIECALLPGSVRHRYDKHPFTLTYSFPNVKDKDHPAQVYYCEICEDDIDPHHWFYHCHEHCDQSLHMKCIFPNFNNRYSNITYQTIFKPRYHGHHSLTCVPQPENDGDKSLCSFCERLRRYTSFPFIIKCTECNFWVHYYCSIILFEDTV